MKAYVIVKDDLSNAALRIHVLAEDDAGTYQGQTTFELRDLDVMLASLEGTFITIIDGEELKKEP